MTVKLPKPTSLKNALSLDDLFLPLGFKQHLLKSIINPMKESGVPDDYSGIIFGPPGTGKTTILKAVAKELDWQIIELGPHDFLRHPNPENAMIDYFSLISKQVSKKFKKTIFVFDEIDEFVVSRDNRADRETRFATTMMLPLFQELRDLADKTKNFTFFVLTNHIERFDPAIKRKGRFDLILPLGPPDYQARYLQFDKHISVLKEKYSKKYNLIINTEISYEISYDLPINGKKIKQTEPVRRIYTDFDIIARTSERLSLADVRSMCEKVVEDRIAEEPNLRANKQNKKSSFIEIRTSRFIDWINRYRKTDPETQKEIERFYRNAEIYSRGSLPYTQTSTLQEKAERQFSSLIINHNIDELTEKPWKVNQGKVLKFSFTNLSEFNGFSGSMVVTAIIGKKRIVGPQILQATSRGQSSRSQEFKLKPTKKGNLELEFTISGEFFLVGSETILDHNSATLKGVATQKKIIQIK